jgi:hypothetical protein
MQEAPRRKSSIISTRKTMIFKRIVSLLWVVFLVSSPIVFLNTVTAASMGSGAVSIVNAADGTSNFNFTTAQKEVGDTFVVNVTIIDALDVATWQVEIEWNNSLLRFVSMTIPSDNIFADKSPVVVPPISFTAGSIVMGANVGPEQTAFNGSGTVAQLTLLIKKAPQQGQTVETDIGFDDIGIDTFLLDSSLGDISADFVWNSAHCDYAWQGGSLLIHDVDVTVVVPSSTSVVNGSSLIIAVTVINSGSFTETFTIEVAANLTYVAPSQTATDLAVGASMALDFVWNTTGWALGDYTIEATADLPGDPTPADNTLVYGVIHVTKFVEKPQVATISTDPSVVQSTTIGQNFTVNINISNVTALSGWDAGVTFNSTVLRCTGLYEGEFLRRSNTSVIFANDAIDDGGILKLGAVLFHWGSSSVNGSGQLAYATFTSVGIGVSDVHLTDVVLYNKFEKIPFEVVERGIPFEVVEIFTVLINETIYGVGITENFTGTGNAYALSGVFNIAFDLQDKKLSFDAHATEDWFCQVSVPKELLSCNSSSGWMVNVDEAPIPYTVTENTTYTALYFGHDKGNHSVEIIGTDVIGGNLPNLPVQDLAPPPLLVAAVASICLTALMAALVDFKRTRSSFRNIPWIRTCTK